MTTLQFKDLRHLHLLNRKERQAYLKHAKGQKTMKINLTLPIEAFAEDGSIITVDAKGALPDRKYIIVRALRAPIAQDAHTGLKEKNDRYLLIKRVNQVDELEFTEGEAKMVMDRIGKVFQQVELIGLMYEAFYPAPAPVTTAPDAVQPEAKPPAA